MRGLVKVKIILNEQFYLENSTVWGENQQKFEVNGDYISQHLYYLLIIRLK
jgi:hypothetical protein